MAKRNPQAARYSHDVNKELSNLGAGRTALKSVEQGLWSWLTSACLWGVILIHASDKQQQNKRWRFKEICVIKHLLRFIWSRYILIWKSHSSEGKLSSRCQQTSHAGLSPLVMLPVALCSATTAQSPTGSSHKGITWVHTASQDYF